MLKVRLMMSRHREKSPVGGRSIKTIVVLEHEDHSGAKVQRPWWGRSIKGGSNFDWLQTGTPGIFILRT